MTAWDNFCYYGGIVGFFVTIGVVVEAIRTGEHILIARAVPILLASLYLYAQGRKAKQSGGGTTSGGI
jgi:hypothetical protein